MIIGADKASTNRSRLIESSLVDNVPFAGLRIALSIDPGSRSRCFASAFLSLRTAAEGRLGFPIAAIMAFAGRHAKLVSNHPAAS
jgi:hypothetical protein